MSRRTRQLQSVLAALIVALCAKNAGATTIQELVRIKGHEQNTLIGLGIVIGLDGTGDRSKDSLVAARPYAQLLANLGDPVGSLEELAKADAYAIVQVTMEIPPTGARSGDRRDVTVSCLFNATSLSGGELVMSPLRVPLPGAQDLAPMAFANGQIVLEGENPRTGRVRGGGQMVTDIRTNPVTAAGTITLVLDDQYAGFPVANMIAGVINDEFALDGYPDLAVVEDAKNIRVTIPQPARPQPAGFIATLLTVPVDPSLIQTEARVVINERQGIILVTGDVQVGPVLITHKGLSIASITPEPEPTPDQPAVRVRRWAEMNTTERGRRSATRLADLLQAFDQLNISVSDQIAIVYELKRSGKLHAEIVNQ